MYGLSYSHRRTEGRLCVAILFASFATMATVADLEELAVFRRRAVGKALHATKRAGQRSSSESRGICPAKPRFTSKSVSLLCVVFFFCLFCFPSLKTTPRRAQKDAHFKRAFSCFEWRR